MKCKLIVFITTLLGIIACVLTTCGGVTASPALTTPRPNDSSVANAFSNVTTSGSSILEWTHLSSKNGDLPEPGIATQQTASLILDVDKDGIKDFVIGSRQLGSLMVWYQRNASGWTKYLIDDATLNIEAGGAFYDIDGDGDLDIVMGGDSGVNKVWWWENPYPSYDPDTPWTRYEIKNLGSNKHHDQIFGDFDGDGLAELVFWNQSAEKLFITDIPSDPKNTQPWSYTEIYSWSSGEHEGLAKADIDGDGKMDIVGGGRWFKHNGGTSYTANIIDDDQRFTRAATGQLKAGGRPEVVFVAGDGVGRLKWYEWTGSGWVGHDLLGFNVDHGHSLEMADIDGDGDLDIFCAEMRLDGGNADAKMWVFLGDGDGNFTQTEVATGYGNHESKVGDLDGDGDLDILDKPYHWDTPRVDIWLNNGTEVDILPLDQWERHVVDSEKPWRALFITSADIDGDDEKDIITGGWWYENPGSPDGTWTRHTIGSLLNNMATVYDFDGDGDVDVLGTQRQGSDASANFVWARNDGSGLFTILNNVEAGDGDFLQGVAVERFQGGDLEVALSWHVADKGVQMLTVPSNPSSDTWPWRQISPTSQDEALSADDIDGDGDIDLLLGTKWLRNDGGSWSVQTLNSASGLPDRNRLADINGDGRLDAVVGYESNKLAWYERGSSATSTWSEHLIATDIVRPMSVDVADMDNDGDIDLVVGEHNLADPSSAKLYVFENDYGQGTSWTEHVIYTGDEHHDGAQVVDIDGDGDLDIISIGWSHDRVLLYENQAIDGGGEKPTAATPTISPDGGTFSGPVTVTLSTTTPEASIYCTLDGSEPISTSTLYTEPFVLLVSAEVKARGFRSGYNPSGVASASFTIITAGPRITNGQQVLYTFEEGSGTTVNNVSAVDTGLNLSVENGSAVSWLPGRGLAINSPTIVASASAATKVINASQDTNEITIEAWVKPANTTQEGPARIVTLSQDPYNRNFTLAQGLWDDQPSALYDMRLRTTSTDNNGRPSLTAPDGSLTTELTHVVYTRDASGVAKIYVNGIELVSGSVGGDFFNWNEGYRLALANELTEDRPWLGQFHLVAIFNRALSQAEVSQNFNAGLAPTSTPRVWLPLILKESHEYQYLHLWRSEKLFIVHSE